MLKKLLSHLLCLIFLCTSSPVISADGSAPLQMTEQELRLHYPHARIIHVEKSDYPRLAERLARQGYALTAAADLEAVENGNNEAAPDKAGQHEAGRYKVSPYKVSQENKASNDDCAGSQGDESQPSASDESFRVLVDITDDILHSGNNSSGGEGAAVVFVIVGAVVILVWALYVFKYIYDLAAGFRPCGRWSELGFVSSSISSTGIQHIAFDGVRYMTGFRDGNTDVGIAVELGHSDILLTEVTALQLQGRYWFLGPVLRWRLSRSNNPHYFQMNFMGGSTEHDEIGVIAKASLGLRFGLGDHLHLGLSWGAMNVELNNDQGIISDRDQYHYLYGVSAGFRF